ncbi:MAG TPA: AMP-binding protein, partial [Baekduia sp.]|nr:AMP-binding protein [Baekduia sp.]
MTDYAWVPTAAAVEHANITRLMRRHGVDDLEAMRARSVADVDWYWDAVVQDLGLPFTTPYTAVRDSSAGIEWTTWFTGGRFNAAQACVGRWLDDAERAAAPAIVHEAETGEVATLTYAQLAEHVQRTANGLRARGIGDGDVVAIFLPMVPEAAIALYAIAAVGAVALPLFSGFAAGAVAARLQDGEAKLVFTADGTWRRGKQTMLKPVLDEALAACPSVEHVVVHRGLGLDVAWSPGQDIDWADFEQAGEQSFTYTDTDAEAALLIGYTSGTTGRPKGAVHTHAGFVVKVASEVAYEFDVHPGDVYTWITDMGWIMGPLSVMGVHALGGTLLLYEGAPDTPGPDRVWRLVERHRVDVLGVSPTLIRALKAAAPPPGDDVDLSSLRIFGSSGEPWDDDAYNWLAVTVGDRARPVINFSGGTEVGGAFLAPYPIEPLRSCSLGGPSLGMDVDVFDPQGRSLRGSVGELVCRQPWPAMTRGVYRDPERYIESYWSMYPGVWRHGDWARVDADGQWFLLGRSDEALNVAGKRVGPAEVETELLSHPAVAEAATIGVPDGTKGEAIWCFWTPVDPDGEDVSDALTALVADRMGRPFKPSRVVRVSELPRTRSAKILRRAVRAVAIGEDPGDLSGAENPEALDVV